jgi:hypothetical protein
MEEAKHKDLIVIGDNQEHLLGAGQKGQKL